MDGTDSGVPISAPARKRGALRLLQCFIVCMPFLSVLALTSWLPLPMIYVAVASLLYLAGTGGRLSVRLQDLLLVLVFLLSLIGAATSLEYVGPLTVAHTIGFGGAIIMYFLVVRSMLANAASKMGVSRAFTWMLWLLSIYVIIEFIGANVYGIDFASLMPHYREDIGTGPGATVFGLFVRPRGFAEEAGHTALLYELGLPLSLLWVRERRASYSAIFYGLAILAFTLLFSVAAFLALAGAIALVFLISQRVMVVRQAALVVSAIAAMWVIWPNIGGAAVSTIESRLSIFEEQPDSRSAITRRSRFETSIGIARDRPLGLGFGTVYQARSDDRLLSGSRPPESTISLPFEVLLAAGVLGLSIFVVFWFGEIFQLMVVKGDFARLSLLSLLALSAHYLVISNFWFPVLWFGFALSDVVASGNIEDG